MKMDLYCYDRELRVIEQGACDCDAALERLEQCFLNALLSYDSGEEAVAATSFGLSRSQTDFIEVSCHGRDGVSIHSDRLSYPSRLRSLFSSKKQLSINVDKEAARDVIRDYFTMEREAFEASYADFLCR